jgi:ribonuclease E
VAQEPSAFAAESSQLNAAASIEPAMVDGQGLSAAEQGLRPPSEPGQRDKRSRDRYGRERGQRGERAERGDSPERSPRDPAAVDAGPDNTAQNDLPFNGERTIAQLPADPVSTAVETVQAAPALVPALAPVSMPVLPQAAKGLPRVQAYELPLSALNEVAQNSGLQWVNSDAAKVAAVQAAIAAEPKPAHVPRERPPAVVIDAGPLVLVETKRDLRDMKLPFEETAG